jgi:hypothetical protein
MTASPTQAPAHLAVLARPRTGRHRNSQSYRPANRRFQEIPRPQVAKHLPELLRPIPSVGIFALVLTRT